MDSGIFTLLCLYLQASTIAEEEDDPILLKHRKNRGKATESSESMADTAVIKKLHVSFINLQKVKWSEILLFIGQIFRCNRIFSQVQKYIQLQTRINLINLHLKDLLETFKQFTCTCSIIYIYILYTMYIQIFCDDSF